MAGAGPRHSPKRFHPSISLPLAEVHHKGSVSFGAGGGGVCHDINGAGMLSGLSNTGVGGGGASVNYGHGFEERSIEPMMSACGPSELNRTFGENLGYPVVHQSSQQISQHTSFSYYSSVPSGLENTSEQQQQLHKKRKKVATAKSSSLSVFEDISMDKGSSTAADYKTRQPLNELVNSMRIVSENEDPQKELLDRVQSLAVENRHYPDRRITGNLPSKSLPLAPRPPGSLKSSSHPLYCDSSSCETQHKDQTDGQPMVTDSQQVVTQVGAQAHAAGQLVVTGNQLVVAERHTAVLPQNAEIRVSQNVQTHFSSFSDSTSSSAGCAPISRRPPPPPPPTSSSLSEPPLSRPFTVSTPHASSKPLAQLCSTVPSHVPSASLAPSATSLVTSSRRSSSCPQPMAVEVWKDEKSLHSRKVSKSGFGSNPATSADKPVEKLSKDCEEVLENMRLSEREFYPKVIEYMTQQKFITHKMRFIVLDWLFEVEQEYDLTDRTMFYAVNYLDRFLSLFQVDRSRFQLLGCACLFIAAKFQEIQAPLKAHLVYIADETFTSDELLEMESAVLSAMHFRLMVTTSYDFVTFFSSKLKQGPQVEAHALYVLSLFLESPHFGRFYDSMSAAAALLTARKRLFPQTSWSSDFAVLTSYSSSSLQPLVEIFNHLLVSSYERLIKNVVSKEDLPTAVAEKFAHPEWFSVSLLVPMGYAGPTLDQFCDPLLMKEGKLVFNSV